MSAEAAGTGDFTARVHQVVGALDEGEIVTYSEVAAWAGRPGAARAVGGVLARSDSLPWWRVVTVNGRLTPGLESVQATHLARENVSVTGDRVTGFGRRRQRSLRRQR
jgi:methylated-DNA-protein-cysteine methyltransferase-like protein